MKKVLFLLPLMAVLFLNHCADSKDVPSGGGSGGDDTSYKAYDANNHYLGQVYGGYSNNISLISPKGYFYQLGWDGYDTYPNSVYSSSKTELKDIFDYNGYYTFFKKEAFRLFSPSGGYSKPTWFCHEAGYPVNSPKSHYIWGTNDLTNKEYPLVYTQDSLPPGVGFILTECDSSKTGIPDDIQGPITTETK